MRQGDKEVIIMGLLCMAALWAGMKGCDSIAKDFEKERQQEMSKIHKLSAEYQEGATLIKKNVIKSSVSDIGQMFLDTDGDKRTTELMIDGYIDHNVNDYEIWNNAIVDEKKTVADWSKHVKLPTVYVYSDIMNRNVK